MKYERPKVESKTDVKGLMTFKGGKGNQGGGGYR
jgi:hypothetical protein